MKFERTDSFQSDFRRLSDSERELVRRFIPEFHAAAEQVAADPRVRWPDSLRVKSVRGARGVWEATRSFAGPDGRATFEWAQIDGERGIRWRRIGGHDIFRDP